jgi:transcriptional regulator with XRE-family HTH domain
MPMPRKNALAKREVEICKRLREFRDSLGLTRVMFARSIGVDSSVLSNYEHCRSPVRYGVARQLAKHFFLNEAWLAEGRGDMKLILDIGPERPETIPAAMAFSAAYDSFLKPLLEEQSKHLHSADARVGSGGVRTGLGIYDAMRRLILRQVDADIRKAPGKALSDYIKGWEALAESVKRKHRSPSDGGG